MLFGKLSKIRSFSHFNGGQNDHLWFVNGFVNRCSSIYRNISICRYADN